MREVGAVARDVVTGGVEQRAEQGRAHDRLVCGKGVFDLNDVAQSMVGTQQQPVEQRGLGEAPADDLVQAAADERVLGVAAHALGVGQSARGATARGQRDRQALQTVDAGDLLDQVDLAGDVLAADGRRCRLQAVGDLGGLKVERGEDLGLAGAGDLDAEDRAHARLAQADRGRRCALAADVDRAGKHARAAALDHAAGSRPPAPSQHCSGASPFSKREDASLRRPSAQEERWMLGPCQLATSSSTRVVCG